MTNEELKRAASNLKGLARDLERYDPWGGTRSRSDAADLRLILAANRKMREALEGLLASTCGPEVGCGDGGTFVICPPSPDALRKARSALSTKEPGQ